MIATVAGSVLAARLDSVVVEVGGVGLLVHTTPATASAQRHGLQVLLSTSLVVREDSLTLYGFTTDDERDLFELVMSVSGVGPRIAMAMLSVHAPEVLRAAIGAGDLTTLTKVPGIGKKGAERIVLELRDKVGALPGVAASAPTPGVQPRVVEALVGLGWNAKQAQDAVDKVTAADDVARSTPEILRAALRLLGR